MVYRVTFFRIFVLHYFYIFFCFHFYASDALSLELVGSAREIGDTVKINLFL